MPSVRDYANWSTSRACADWYIDKFGPRGEFWSGLREAANGAWYVVAVLVALPFGWAFGLWWRAKCRSEVAAARAKEER
jgi:hypothetical protein